MAALTETEIAALLPKVQQWKVIEVAGVKRLERTFTFENFVEALSFTNKVGDAAEQAGHHPALLTEWGNVTVTWWSHSAGGLQEADFEMAEKTDQLYISAAKSA